MSRKKHSLICYNSLIETHLIIQKLNDVKEYAFIQHYAETEDKKNHIHVYLEFNNPKNESDIIKKFNSNINCIEAVKDKNKLLQYFLHKNHTLKIQYQIEDIHTNIPLKVLQFIVEPKIIINDEDFLESCFVYLDNGFSMRDLIKKCCKEQTINLLRKYWQILIYYNRAEEYCAF